MAEAKDAEPRSNGEAPPGAPVGTELSRTMGLLHVVMIGVGAMIGAGIFVLTGIAAGVAGPALVLVFLLNGIVTTFTAFSYAELGSCFPEAGGGYLWVKQALPQPNGFLSGWMSWFAHAVACSLYAAAFGAFAVEILVMVPVLRPLTEGHGAVKVLAAAITLAFAWINVRGAEETGRAETFVTVVKIVVIGLFCITGLGAILARGGDLQGNFSSLRAFAPSGLGGIAAAMGLTFIAFEGYEIIAQCGEEVKDPRRNIPRSIFVSILVVVPIYVVVAFVAVAGVPVPPEYTGAAKTNWAYLGELKELAMIRAAETFMPFGRLIFLVGGLFSTMSALNATIYSSSRVSFAMGRDHNLPGLFARIHPKRRTPYAAVWISAALVIAMAVLLPIEEVASATDAMFLLLFVLVNLAVVNLRRHKPELDRGFRVPLVPVVPALAAALNLGLAVFLFLHYPLGVGVTAGFIVIGVFLYLFYARPKEASAEAAEVPTVYRRVEAPGETAFRVLTPLANPRSVPGLMRLACILAAHRGGEVIAAHIVRVPSQLPPSAAASLLKEPKALLRKALDVKARVSLPEPAGAEGTAGEEAPPALPVTALVKVAHSIPRAISETVREHDVDLLVLGWRGGVRRNYFFGDVLDETVFNAECDVLMAARPSVASLERAKRIFVPVDEKITGARLSLETALALSAATGRLVTALHVSPRPDAEAEAVRAAFEEERAVLAKELDLSPVKLRIVHARNVYGTLRSEIKDTDLVVVEGRHEGIFSRTFFGAVPERLAQDLPNTVILAKKYPGRVITWFQKFFGTRMPEPHE